VCCTSAGAERRGGVLCADPAYVVIPQEKKKSRSQRNKEYQLDLRAEIVLSRAQVQVQVLDVPHGKRVGALISHAG
jgi:hypothetical protein